MDIGGDGGFVVVVMMVTTVFKDGSFFFEKQIFIFILCGGICGVGPNCKQLFMCMNNWD